MKEAYVAMIVTINLAQDCLCKRLWKKISLLSHKEIEI